VGPDWRVVAAAVQADPPAADVVALGAVVAAVLVGAWVGPAGAAAGRAVPLVQGRARVGGDRKCCRRKSDGRIDRLQRIALVPSVGAVELEPML
jgi:hypothetical protein